MLVNKNYLQTNILFNRKLQTLNYVTSILNVLNYYQLPKLQKVALTFKLVAKDRFIVLAYYALFKYFFNLAPKIQLVRKKQVNSILPTEITLVLSQRNILNFLALFFFPYKGEGVEEKRVYQVSPLYKGRTSTLVLNHFFMLTLFLDILLLYKNDGLFLGAYEKLYCKFISLSKVNLWNYYYFNYFLQGGSAPIENK